MAQLYVELFYITRLACALCTHKINSNRTYTNFLLDMPFIDIYNITKLERERLTYGPIWQVGDFIFDAFEFLGLRN